MTTNGNPGEITPTDANYWRNQSRHDHYAKRLFDAYEMTRRQLQTALDEKDRLAKRAGSNGAVSVKMVAEPDADIGIAAFEQAGNGKIVPALQRGGFETIKELVDAARAEPWTIRVRCDGLGELMFAEIMTILYDWRFLEITPEILQATVMPRDEIEALARFDKRFKRKRPE